LSAVRYSSFKHHDVPFGVTVFTDIIYLSSGLLNVLLFSITRPFLLPHDQAKSDEVSEIMVPCVGITGYPPSDSAHQGGWSAHEVYQWPRSESPVSQIQSNSTCEANTKESETLWYGNEKPVVMNETSHSLDV
jgi:hypothetical protein